jgi:hypothetical protein
MPDRTSLVSFLARDGVGKVCDNQIHGNLQDPVVFGFDGFLAVVMQRIVGVYGIATPRINDE